MATRGGSRWILLFLAVQVCVLGGFYASVGKGWAATAGKSARRYSELAAEAKANAPAPAQSLPTGVASTDDAANILRNRAAADAKGFTNHYPGETVFIALASYGDPECAATVERVYARATHPDRVFMGVYQQHDCHGEDPDNSQCMDCVEGLKPLCAREPRHPVCTRFWQVRVLRKPMIETKGVTYARYMSEKLFRNETYFMALDSHMRFARGWDAQLIATWREIGDDYAVLTNYPSPYEEKFMGARGLGDTYDSNPTAKVRAFQAICKTRRFQSLKVITFHNLACAIPPLTKSIRVAHYAGGFSFSRGHRVLRVPYDPHAPFVFDGEEFSMAVRLWTHGYDLYFSRTQVITHLYLTKEAVAKGAVRRTFWDTAELWEKRHPILTKSTQRVNYILGLHEVNNPKDVSLAALDLNETERYGVGSVRTVRQYIDWARIDLSSKLPAESEDLTSVYLAGGMPAVHRPGIDAPRS